MWVDEDPLVDAGWTKSPVTILVPFKTSEPSVSTSEKGQQAKRKLAKGRVEEYTIPDFYHCSIVGILREKLDNEEELHWQPRDGVQSVHISGELYNSPAFVEAHKEVQALPPEPGCTLPRCVVGLMLDKSKSGQHICTLEMTPNITVKNLPCIFATMSHIFRK